ncbi:MULTISPECIES: amidohydrolase family protein [unclassified Variovorax]|uniref:amidohydrolase family protein n=1 Tax=unclassified Variovorax TaxID=663243 RepID=UPI0025752851|nr:MULTISPECIES: amidohydrolase family protein [unclassified Variovorax]MDM0091717.1 amidohydrolase family protein [Variovorax sp. J22G40]MDM0149798.1 amidohydrolase family protein [Variovorax sp. J2P1-31]
MREPVLLNNVRLPRWLLAGDWPRHDGVPVLAGVAIEGGRVRSVQPAAPSPSAWDLGGRLALPGFVDAHTHLDKAFTLPRMKAVQPGLLGAIDAMLADRAHWTPEDVRERAARGLQWAWACGTTHVRTHVDWWEPDSVPMAWPVMAELAQDWAGKVRLEQVALIKLPLFEDAAQALRLAQQVKATGPHALLGGFVHSTNWSENALRNLLVAAQACDLDVDLHVDEELNAAAVGLQTTARLLREIGYEGRVVCGHICALAVQPEAQAFATLDAVARAPITVVSLPATNLLLQDAVTGRTPRLRGLTLVKEAQARGIPLLFASDNVQDPFCRLGSFDPVEALGTAALVAQLDAPFDTWSQALCRADWLRRGPAPARPTLVGERADLVLFTDADRHGWPSRSANRVVLRDGHVTHGDATPFLPT